MKVAMISTLPIFPAKSGNNVRMLQLCKAIKGLGHELSFIHLGSKPKQRMPDPDAHVAFFGPDHYIYFDKGDRLARNGFRLRREFARYRGKTLRLLGLERGYYSGLDHRWRDAWTRQLLSLNREFDAIIVEYVFNSRALDVFPDSTRKLLDTHDSFANRHRPFVARGFKKGYWLSLTPRNENAGLRRADVVIAIQQEEAENFRKQLAEQENGGRDPDVVAVSHFLPPRLPIAGYGVDHAALYVASNSPANEISLRNFLDHVLPLVVREIPDFMLKIAGSICDWAPDLANVQKLGFVDDLNDAFAGAPLSVNPTLVGTGINIKLLDALSIGVPVATTTTGVRGLPEDFRSGVVVAPDNDPRLFADAIVSLSSDATLRSRLGQAAFADAQRWNATQLAALEQCLLGADGNLKKQEI